MSQFPASHDGDVHDGDGVTSKAETAAHEASDVTATVGHEASSVVRTGAEEVSAVAGEAKAQFSQLLAQTGRELSEQAAGQQQRLAEGARTFGDDLSRMADADEGSGIAGDLVRSVAGHASTAGRWLADRDPQELLRDVKAFARRRPGAFIAGAALAGLVVGRLSRALAAGATASSTHAGSSSGGAPDGPRFAAADARTRATEGTVGADLAGAGGGTVGADLASEGGATDETDTPVYSRSAHLIDGSDDGIGEEQAHDRPDAL